MYVYVLPVCGGSNTSTRTYSIPEKNSQHRLIIFKKREEIRNRDQIVKKRDQIVKKRDQKRDHFSTKVPKRNFSRKNGTNLGTLCKKLAVSENQRTPMN